MYGCLSQHWKCAKIRLHTEIRLSQMRHCYTFISGQLGANFRMQEYMKTRGRFLATASHKYATETTHDYNIDDVHLPP